MDYDYKEYVVINESDNSIEINVGYAGGLMDIDILYDLIKDGLVEKVEG